MSSTNPILILPEHQKLIDNNAKNHLLQIERLHSNLPVSAQSYERSRIEANKTLNKQYRDLIIYNIIEDASWTKEHFKSLTRTLGRPEPIFVDLDWTGRATFRISARKGLACIRAPLYVIATPVDSILYYGNPDAPVLLQANTKSHIYKVSNKDIYANWKENIRTNPTCRRAFKLDLIPEA